MSPENPPPEWREKCGCVACELWRNERRLGIVHDDGFPAWPCSFLQEKSLRAGVVNALALLGAVVLVALTLSEVLR